MIRKTANSVFTFCGILFLFVERAGATTVVPMNLVDLSASASEVVVGKVIRSKAIPTYDKAGRVLSVSSEIRIAVDRYLKSRTGGETGSPYVTLYEYGGVVGDTTIRVSDAPEYIPGENVLLFLKASSRGLNRTLGLYQGKFSIRMTASGQSEVSGRIGKPLSEDLPFVTSESGDGPSEIRMDLDEFETRIEGLIGLAERASVVSPAATGSDRE
jgi:hypothetical protein